MYINHMIMNYTPLNVSCNIGVRENLKKNNKYFMIILATKKQSKIFKTITNFRISLTFQTDGVNL